MYRRRAADIVSGDDHVSWTTSFLGSALLHHLEKLFAVHVHLEMHNSENAAIVEQERFYLNGVRILQNLLRNFLGFGFLLRCRKGFLFAADLHLLPRIFLTLNSNPL
jgi:hypothetical protein